MSANHFIQKYLYLTNYMCSTNMNYTCSLQTGYMFKKSIKLSNLQLVVLKVLWEKGPLTVAEVHSQVSIQRVLALTTVATLLKRLQEKDFVAFEKQGRSHLYYPLVSEKEVKSSMLGNMLQHLFDGKPDDLVHHLVDRNEINEEDLAKIKHLFSQGDNDV